MNDLPVELSSNIQIEGHIHHGYGFYQQLRGIYHLISKVINCTKLGHKCTFWLQNHIIPKPTG
jgi:hypothetical protein